MIRENLESVTQRMARCCEKVGRPPASVRLVVVTKEASIGEINEVIDAGAADIGENRVQDALLKYRIIGDKVTWHMVGHLQTNKVRDAVRIFSLIHSVDSLKLAQAIDREARKIGKVQDIFIEVNTSGEEAKFGLKGNDVIIDFFKNAVLCPNINIKGLMTVAPEVDDPQLVRPYFRSLRELRDKINSLKLTTYSLQLSMGMTNDFEVAIEEGATMVRIGRAIFRR